MRRTTTTTLTQALHRELRIARDCRPYQLTLAWFVLSLAAVVLSLVTLGACSSSTPAETPPPPTPAPTSPATATPATDPYQAYLTLAPAEAPHLTPDDAQTRAMLGCTTTWAPGTVDAALAEAYAPLIEQWRTQGLCG